MSIKISTRLPLIRALQSPSFSFLWIGQTISVLGNGAFTTALAWEVLLLTGSATAMGLVVLAQTLPLLLFLPIGGVAADLFPRRLLMLWSDFGRAAIVLLVAALGWFHLLQLWHLVIMSFCFGLAKCFFDPAYQAIRPQMVESETLSSANALTGLSRQLGLLLGPIVGVWFVSAGGTSLAFVFDGITFLCSAGSLLCIRLPHQCSGDQEQIRSASFGLALQRQMRRFAHHISEGVTYVIGSRWLWISILVASIGNVGFAGSLGVALPKLVHDTYGAGVWLLGVLTVSNAVGAIVATVLVGYRVHVRNRGIIAYLALILYSLSLISFGIPPVFHNEYLLPIVANALIGFGLAAFDIIWVTVMQEQVPNDKLGRVSSIDTLASFVFMPIGYVLGGILTDRIGPVWVFVAGGLLNLLVVSFGLCLRDIRRLD